jgi:hypothetical protein
MDKISPAALTEIIDNLEIGLLCYVNFDTGRILSVPSEDNMSDMDIDPFEEDLNELANNHQDYTLIEPPTSNESFKFMEDFVETVDDVRLHNRLINALGHSKPFRNFKDIIDDSGPYREAWFKFRDTAFREWVIEQIELNGPRD